MNPFHHVYSLLRLTTKTESIPTPICWGMVSMPRWSNNPIYQSHITGMSGLAPDHIYVACCRFYIGILQTVDAIDGHVESPSKY